MRPHPPTQLARTSIGRRGQAAVLTVALGIGAVLPAGAAIGQEADQVREGTAAPEHAIPEGAPDSSANPEFDPGGPNSDLPIEAPALLDQPEAPPTDAPAETEPADDPDLPQLELDQHTAPPADTTEPAQPPAQPVAPAPAPTPAPATPPAVEAPTAPAAAPPPATEPQRPDPRQRGRARERKVLKRQTSARKEPTSPSAPAPTTATAPNVVEDSPAPPVVATNPAQNAQSPSSQPTGPLVRRLEGRRFYVVQDDPRESLWEIAADLLGPRASDADVSAGWQRIYRLNRALIGTDPGIIVPGMRLRLH